MIRLSFRRDKGSSSIARDRLQSLLKQDRNLVRGEELISRLRQQLLVMIGEKFSTVSERIALTVGQEPAGVGLILQIRVAVGDRRTLETSFGPIDNRHDSLSDQIDATVARHTRGYFPNPWAR